MNRIVVALITVLVSFSLVPFAQGAFILDTAQFGGSTYHLLGNSADGLGIRWTDAEAYAVTLGGHLATISSAAENDFLFDRFGAAQFGTRPQVDSLFIGITDQVSEGTFTWISGEPVVYTNWAAGEPNNTRSREDWGSFAGANQSPLFPDGTWNDVPNIASTLEVGDPNNEPLYAIMEINAIVPEPGSMTLVSIAILSLAGFASRRKKQLRVT